MVREDYYAVRIAASAHKLKLGFMSFAIEIKKITGYPTTGFPVLSVT